MFEIASLKEGMMHGVELFQLLLEIISIACVVIGLGKTLWLAARVRDHQPGFPRIRLCFGSWLILALEFQLAADILATTVAPSKEELIRLAIIAVIRTFLNYFLGKELEAQAERQQEQPEAGSSHVEPFTSDHVDPFLGSGRSVASWPSARTGLAPLLEARYEPPGGNSYRTCHPISLSQGGLLLFLSRPFFHTRTV